MGEYTGIVSLVLNLLLGGGLIVTVATLRHTKKEAGAKAAKAVAAARADELKNVEHAIRIWREIAESVSDNYREVCIKLNALELKVDPLEKEIKRLNSINNKILKLLDKITPENLENMRSIIKKEIKSSEL